MNTSVNIAGVQLKNPIITASGTCGFMREYEEFYNPSELGGLCLKGLTLFPRQGNKPPRIAQTPSGILNSVGLQNPGVEVFVKEHLPYLRKFDTKLIANISGNTVEEYGQMCKMLSDARIDMIELNVSCPNVKAGGIAFGTVPESAAQVTHEAKKNSSVPVIVKLSPNVTDITAIAKSVEQAGADAISLINTILGMRIDIATRRPVLNNNYGGLSGPAVFPVAVRMINQVKNATNIPIIGMGGVADGQDAYEMMLAGATAVAVGTAAFYDVQAPVRIKKELEKTAKEMKIENICDIINRVRLN